ncbi:MAG: 2-oxoglutarate dehydrogenase complex dihydrolipoyllysine-residue succinyltransferase [Anaerolineaceae bacterium]
MSIEIIVPEMGESVFEATITSWKKTAGEQVSVGEAVVELETDKVNLEVGAPQSGVIERIEKQEGETVVVGEVIAFLTPGENQASAHVVAPAPESAQSPVAPPVRQGTPASAGYPSPHTSFKVTPLAERLAQENSVDLSQVKPTGSGGRITKEDVESYLQSTTAAAPAVNLPLAAPPTVQQPVAPAAPAETSRVVRKRMSRRRQTIARRMVEAQQTAAMLTTFNEVDMTRVIELRKRRREAFKARFGVDLGFMGFFIKAVVGALKAFPALNAEIQGDEIVFKNYYDIGIAIGAEEGLVVPVIRNADKMSFAQLEESIRAFVNRVREGALSIEDLRGGTFTITNGGVFGSLLSTPILNPPQVGILGMHVIQERPVAIDGQVVIRPMMYVALSYDHRIVDGREAIQFLAKIKELVEDPEVLLFE